jgi:tRNA (guanine37-N1)-methyltransferase
MKVLINESLIIMILKNLSVSDVVLNGGEIASLLFMESFIRLQPEVLGNQDTHLKESFHDDLLGARPVY